MVAHLSGAKLENSLLDTESVDAAKEALKAFSPESLNETLLTAISLILSKEGIPVPLRLGTVISSFTAPLFTETDLRHLIVRAK